MALFLVLVVTTLLLFLTGAFLCVNRSNMALMGSFISRASGMQACLSGLNYAWIRLESDKYWAKAVFPRGTRVYHHPANGTPVMQIREIGDGAEARNNIVEGEVLGTGATFSIRMINNLDGRSPLMADRVPAYAVRLQISGVSGPATRRMEAILRLSHFVDASAVCSEDMTVRFDDESANPRWVIRSRDPLQNLVRSNKNIFGPDAINRNQVLFVPHEGVRAKDPPYGVAWARKNISLAGLSLTDPKNGAQRIATAQARSHGLFKPEGNQPYRIPDLNPRGIDLPDARVNLGAGKYVFANVSVQQQKEVTVEEPPRSGNFVNKWVDAGSSVVPALKRVAGNVKDLWYLEPSPGSGLRTVGYSIGAENYHPVTDDFFAIKDGEVDAAYVDLTSHTFGLPRNFTVHVDGGFELSSDKYGTTPMLFLGCQLTSYQLGDTPGALAVKGGDVKIRGTVSGYGSMIADEGSIDRYAKSALSPSPDRGIAVFAGSGIQIVADPNARDASTNLGGMLASDWDAFKDAFTGYPNKAALDNWRGLSAEQQAALLGGGAASGGFQDAKMASSTTYWGNLGDIVVPDAAAQKARDIWCGLQSGCLTVAQYIRLREYLKSVKRGSPNANWLNPAAYGSRVLSIIDAQLSRYAHDAGDVYDYGLTLTRPKYLSEFFAGASNPYKEIAYPDVSFRGLIYTRNGDFVFNADKKGIAIEGAVVVRNGNLKIEDASCVDFNFSPAYLDKFVRSPFSQSARLEKVLCVMY